MKKTESLSSLILGSVSTVYMLKIFSNIEIIIIKSSELLYKEKINFLLIYIGVPFIMSIVGMILGFLSNKNSQNIYSILAIILNMLTFTLILVFLLLTVVKL